MLCERITEEIKDKVRRAIRMAGCLQRDRGGVFRDVVQVWLDLDRIWFDRESSAALNGVVPLLFPEPKEFDVVAGVSATAGSAGCYPFCLALREQLQAKFLLVRTGEFGLPRVFPTSLDGPSELANSRILLVKDVILYGETVEHSHRALLSQVGVGASAVLSLVDHEPEGRAQLLMGGGIEVAAILGREDLKAMRQEAAK